MSKRVLVVDDDSMSRTILAMQLEYAGYQVRTARGGWEGLMVAVAWSPDLVVADIAMPELDGPALLAELRQRSQLSHVPVLLISGGAAPVLGDPLAQFLQKDQLSERLSPIVAELLTSALQPRPAMA